MFNSARLKLTAWYLLIIMFISISFSAVIYNFLTSEFNRVLRVEKLRQQGMWVPQRNGFQVFIDDDTPGSQKGIVITPPNPEIVEEAKDRLLYILIAINLAILGMSGALGFFLAGRTLRPIQFMVDEQNRFITDASHELRTPLTSLKSEIEVNLRDKNLKLKAAKELLESNLEEVNSLQYLSDNLIKLAQTHKPNGIKFENISFLSIYNQALKKVEKLAKKKNITIISDIDDLKIKGDGQGLTELLVILIDNAIKYSDEKSEVKVISKKSRNNLVIKISDNGVGIDKEDLPFLFERFYRAEKSRTKDGFGLGLSIAKQIVEKHNGSIEVDSEVNKGTTFTIKLPIKH